MKPSLPQGTRDFSHEVVYKRQYILQTIRQIFERYGFQPLETPAMENIDTLMGKYGEEGDKLIFKILNNGLDNPNKEQKTREALEEVFQGKWSKQLTERALRYDLTIPFARFVAMNHGSLVFPFKRYQIQPVWRADRPQRGRYREFYQCDCDVVGSSSLINEVELIHIYDQAFTSLQIPVSIQINNRKILAGLAEICGGQEQLTDITIAIDKLDKIGLEKVKEELTQRGLDQAQIEVIEQYLNIKGSNNEQLTQIEQLLSESKQAMLGVTELRYLLDFAKDSVKSVQLDFTLARGLNYYTGTIFEIKASTVKMGSIGGGGRYDDLTGLFGVKDVPGVGISFGIDRIYDVMEELNLFEGKLSQGTEVLFFNLGSYEIQGAYPVIQKLRQAGIRTELYHEPVKFDKQFKFAEKKGIPYIAIIGSEEITDNKITIKHLPSGWQEQMDSTNIDHIVQALHTQREDK
ncbi:histidyl-tRNA synthetase [Arachidicoccus rhizosphaerae]|uniref:Histidine--tRNA ligase n=1 Tax=Arachidicoccus rhizosphaerae TaxID=551991 RepID=A0A1H3WI93_9BACT|nr:histidine--tRNA ligase [Arachidicoccus rhizosphaerae]SDZ86887.1 histidyl-tRNA synthetase [Arachidicoccus rhizosphaerae]